jgi:hypothetical protein
MGQCWIDWSMGVMVHYIKALLCSSNRYNDMVAFLWRAGYGYAISRQIYSRAISLVPDRTIISCFVNARLSLAHSSQERYHIHRSLCDTSTVAYTGLYACGSFSYELIGHGNRMVHISPH